MFSYQQVPNQVLLLNTHKNSNRFIVVRIQLLDGKILTCPTVANVIPHFIIGIDIQNAIPQISCSD